MTKDDLVTEVVKNCKGDDLSKRLVSDVIDATFASIGKSIKKDKRFSYPAFGTFTVRNRKARKGRNPQTGAEIKTLYEAEASAFTDAQFTKLAGVETLATADHNTPTINQHLPVSDPLSAKQLKALESNE